jgi:hypothetical protein
VAKLTPVCFLCIFPIADSTLALSPITARDVLFSFPPSAFRSAAASYVDLNLVVYSASALRDCRYQSPSAPPVPTPDPNLSFGAWYRVSDVIDVTLRRSDGSEVTTFAPGETVNFTIPLASSVAAYEGLLLLYLSSLHAP